MKVKERIRILRIARSKMSLLREQERRIYTKTLELLHADADDLDLLHADADDIVIFDYLYNGGSAEDTERWSR